MKEEKKLSKKAGVHWGILFGVIVVVLIFGTRMMPTPVLEQDDEGTWQIVMKVSSTALGAEADPGSGESGWLATFCLDYAETPATCLASNATDGAYDGWGNVSGYVSADDAEIDLKSEDPFYFVVRGRFNDTVKDGSDFIDGRCKIMLTVSGDETISDVEGTRVVSYNDTGADYIYINFYWDDASDGYRITDDGSLAWNITVYAKY